MNATQPTIRAGNSPGRKKPGGRWRAGLAVLVVLVMMVGGLAGVCYLLVRKAQEEYSSIKSQVKSKVTGHVTNSPAAQPMATIQNCPTVATGQLAELRKSQAGALIPLAPDLIIGRTWVYYNADLEELTRVVSVEDDQIKFTFSGPPAHAENGKAIVAASVVVPGYPQCQADLFSSHLLVTEINPELSIPLVGTTRIGVSQQVYADLKAGRRIDFEYRSHLRRAGAGYTWGYDFKGEMQRDVLAQFHYKTIVNGTLTELPAVHTMGLLGGYPTQMAVLDDPGNPMLLDLEIPNLQFALRVTNIGYPTPKKIESELKDNKRAEIYGIYFDFDSAAIRPESEPVLAEIAEAMRQNSGWILNIGGHTDSIGGDAHNLDLSLRRAEAVKRALAERYSIPANSLTTQGFGASQPKATNDTVEGRALNRRVELVRP